MSPTPPKIADITPEDLEHWADQLAQGMPVYQVFVTHQSARGVHAIDTLRWYVAHRDAGTGRVSQMIDLHPEAIACIEAGELIGELVSGLAAASCALRSLSI